MNYDPYWRNPNILWKKSSILAAEPFTVAEYDKFHNEATGSDHFHTAIAPGANTSKSSVYNHFTKSIPPPLSVLTMSQLFGVFPLQSVRNRAPESMTFRTVSVTCVVSAISIFGGYAISLLSLIRQGRALNAINIAEPFFFSICATSSVIFWQMAKQWQAIIVTWSRTERKFLHHPFRKTVLKWKIRSVATVLLLLAFGERKHPSVRKTSVDRIFCYF